MCLYTVLQSGSLKEPIRLRMCTRSNLWLHVHGREISSISKTQFGAVHGLGAGWRSTAWTVTEVCQPAQSWVTRPGNVRFGYLSATLRAHSPVPVPRSMMCWAFGEMGDWKRTFARWESIINHIKWPSWSIHQHVTVQCSSLSYSRTWTPIAYRLDHMLEAGSS